MCWFHPTANLSAFSPINLTSSAVFDDDGDGNEQPHKQDENKTQSNKIVVATDAASESKKLEKRNENPR